MALAHIHVRLGAIGAVLGPLSGTDRHAPVSVAQAAGLLDLIRRSKGGWTGEETAEVAALVSAIHWHGATDMEILKVLASNAKGGRKLQDYLSFVAFFTEKHWRHFLCTDVCPNAVLMEMIKSWHVSDAGIRPSTQAKWLTAAGCC